MHVNTKGRVCEMSDLPIKTFGSSEIIDVLVGITPVYLNMFLQRKLYGIEATESDRHRETKFRLFNEADVFGIALAWMLFESGLRTQPIRCILNELAKTKRANANKAAKVLLESEAEYIVLVREPRKPKPKHHPDPKVTMASGVEISGILAENPLANLLIVPIGARFRDIKRRIEVLFGE